ncbi:hypothetical protein KC357_g188 [Hortaea werneckii]|nr:hypothetical protein KC357_g188 [Hortaea werneckii]
MAVLRRALLMIAMAPAGGSLTISFPLSRRASHPQTIAVAVSGGRSVQVKLWPRTTSTSHKAACIISRTRLAPISSVSPSVSYHHSLSSPCLPSHLPLSLERPAVSTPSSYPDPASLTLASPASPRSLPSTSTLTSTSTSTSHASTTDHPRHTRTPSLGFSRRLQDKAYVTPKAACPVSPITPTSYSAVRNILADTPVSNGPAKSAADRPSGASWAPLAHRSPAQPI